MAKRCRVWKKKAPKVINRWRSKLHAMQIKRQPYTFDNNKKKKNTPNNFNTNYRRDMKLVPINLVYCLLQFDVLKFFLGVRLHGGRGRPNFNFFNVNPQMFQRNRKVELTNCLETNFYSVSNISLRVRHRSYN